MMTRNHLSSDGQGLTASQLSEGILPFRTPPARFWIPLLFRAGYGTFQAMVPAGVPPVGTESERKYWSELLAPIVRLGHEIAREFFAVKRGRVGNDVAGFIDERHP